MALRLGTDACYLKASRALDTTRGLKKELQENGAIFQCFKGDLKVVPVSKTGMEEGNNVESPTGDGAERVPLPC